MTTGPEQVGDVLAALADPTRRQILALLAAHEHATATVMAAKLPVSRQAVVKHLVILGRAGLVTGRREGREMRYTVQPQQLGIAARWLTRTAAEWDTRLAGIKNIAEAGSAGRGD